MTEPRRPLSTRLIALLVSGVTYVCTATIAWGYAVNHAHILEHHPWEITISLWWWAVILLPLTVLTALLTIPFRTALFALVLFVLTELVVWMGSLLYSEYKLFGVHQTILLEWQWPAPLIELLFGLLLGSINVAAQFTVLWITRVLQWRVTDLMRRRRVS